MAAICNVPVALRATAKRTVAKRGMSVKAAAGPQHWLPGTEPPAYLDGTMAGDYGFDPLRLGQNPETLPYLQEAELMNGRWAMHATAGILFTDAVGLPKFWEAGEAALGDWDIKTLVAIQVVVMGFLEAARIRGFMATGESGVVGNFPFDPTGQDSPAMKVKEIKNGRLAMMSFLGMVSQYAVTGTSPGGPQGAHGQPHAGEHLHLLCWQRVRRRHHLLLHRALLLRAPGADLRRLGRRVPPHPLVSQPPARARVFNHSRTVPKEEGVAARDDARAWRVTIF